jgi:tetratricopeptide (TPR) repeat protein
MRNTAGVLHQAPAFSFLSPRTERVFSHTIDSQTLTHFRMPILRKLAWLAASLLLNTVLHAQTADARTTAIISALRDQQFDQALHLLDAALKSAPANPQFWTMQGVARQGQGNQTEALASFRRAIKLSPNYMPALEKVAQIEYDAGDPAGVPILEHILSLRPDDLTSHAMLAVLQYQKGDCAGAASHFEKATSLFDSKPAALHAYGSCLVKLKRFETAAEVFQRSLALNAGDARERQVLASVQMMAHQPQPALATLEPLLGPAADASSLELASAAYEDLHDTGKAVETLQRAILLDPHNVTLYVDFAALSATHQSVQVGIDVVNDGINLEPKAAQLYFARGVLYVQLADYDKAQADFEKAYELDGNQSLSVAALSLTAVQQNDIPGALAGVRAKLAHRPDDPILLYLEADLLAQQGAEAGSADFAAALRAAKKAVALRPNLGAAHGVLARLYLESGNYAQAAIHGRKALEIDPRDQGSLYRLVQTLKKSGKNEEIPELLKRIASLRQQAAQNQRELNRYKLVEGEGR